jgi:hypothetical protein
MMALVSTLSIHQARALRDSLYRHLAFRGFLGSTYPVRTSILLCLPFDEPDAHSDQRLLDFSASL